MSIDKSIWSKVQSNEIESLETLSYKISKIDSIYGIDIYVGVGTANFRKAILIRAKLELLPSKDFPPTKGLSLKTQGTDKQDERYVILELSSDEYLDVFVSLCNDVHNSLKKSVNTEDLIKKYYSRIASWKLFFSKTRDGVLSQRRRVGLYAELSFIIEKLIPTFGAGFLKYWAGPEGKPHDIEMGKLGIEIKSSTGTKGHKATISNEQQLDDEGLDCLYLYFNAISETNNHPATIPAAIADIKKVIAHDEGSIEEFEVKLMNVGYNPIFEDKYNKWGYKVKETRVFRVEEGFPRIISKNVPNGCGGIKYNVELSACNEFEEKVEIIDEKINQEK